MMSVAFLKIRIVAGHVPLKPIRLEAGFLRDAMHDILTNAQSSSKFAATPVRRAVLGRLARRRQKPSVIS